MIAYVYARTYIRIDINNMKRMEPALTLTAQQLNMFRFVIILIDSIHIHPFRCDKTFNSTETVY